MNQNLDTKIRSLDDRILENHRFDADLFGRLTQAQHDLGILDKGRPFCPFLRPKFLTRQKYSAVVRAAEVLACAFDRLTFAALDNPGIMSELDLSPREQFLAQIDPGYKGVCNSSRLDGFFDGDDFKFLEYNAESPAGTIDQMQIMKVLEMIPEVGEFLDANEHWRPLPHEKLLQALIADYREFGGAKEKPSIAIVDWDDVGTVSEFRVLSGFFESRGHDTRIIDPSDLEYDGDVLSADGFAIDIFYKRVLIHEYLERFDDDSPLIRAYADGNIFMANSFRTKIPHKKSGFAVVADERFAHLFTAEQLEMIRRHIPWTRRVREQKTDFGGSEIDLLEHVGRDRENFILKPNDDYGGSGIVFGWESGRSEWYTALDAALEGSYVVQERVPVGKVTVPSYENEVVMLRWLIDFDPFLFRGKVEGGLVRMSDSSLVNVAAGGGETALIIIED